jgi:hypothetical protein
MTEQTNQDPGLSLQDIAMCVMIIDTVTQRGAFRGEELADVGGLRNKLKAFLDARQPAPAPQEEKTEEEA